MIVIMICINCHDIHNDDHCSKVLRLIPRAVGVLSCFWTCNRRRVVWWDRHSFILQRERCQVCLIISQSLFISLPSIDHALISFSACIAQILECLKECHRNNIIHRDVKVIIILYTTVAFVTKISYKWWLYYLAQQPIAIVVFFFVCSWHTTTNGYRTLSSLQPENLILASHAPNAAVKLTDFGLAVIMEPKPTFYGLLIASVSCSFSKDYYIDLFCFNVDHRGEIFEYTCL